MVTIKTPKVSVHLNTIKGVKCCHRDITGGGMLLAEQAEVLLELEHVPGCVVHGVCDIAAVFDAIDVEL